MQDVPNQIVQNAIYWRFFFILQALLSARNGAFEKWLKNINSEP